MTGVFCDKDLYTGAKVRQGAHLLEQKLKVDMKGLNFRLPARIKLNNE
jgi:hypothetical protein